MRRKILVFLLVFPLGIAPKAQAAPACAWSLESGEAVYVDGLTACAKTGTTIRVVVLCVGAPNGGLVAPDGLGATVTSVHGGWEAAFPAQAGTFRFTAWVGNETETRDVTIVSPSEPPPEAFVTHGEFDPVRQVYSRPRLQKRGRVTVGGTWTPTLSTTTKPSGGFVVEAGGKPVAGLLLTGLVGVEWGGAPINPELHPTVEQATLVAHTEQLRFYLAITPHEVVAVNLGLGLGVKTYSWDQELIRQTTDGRVMLVSDSSDSVGIIVPTLSVDLIPHPNVAVGAAFDLVMPLAGHLSTVGSPETASQVEPLLVPLRIGGVF